MLRRITIAPAAAALFGAASIPTGALAFGHGFGGHGGFGGGGFGHGGFGGHGFAPGFAGGWAWCFSRPGIGRAAPTFSWPWLRCPPLNGGLLQPPPPTLC